MKNIGKIILAAALCLCLLGTLTAPAACALFDVCDVSWWIYWGEERLKEEAGSDGSRTVYVYDRDGGVVGKRLYEGGALTEEIEYRYGSWGSHEAIIHVLGTGVDVYRFFDASGVEIGRDETGGLGSAVCVVTSMGDTIRESYNARGYVESVTVTRGSGARETGEFRYDGDGHILSFRYGGGTYWIEETFAYNQDGSWSRDRREYSGSENVLHVFENYDENMFLLYRSVMAYGGSSLTSYEYNYGGLLEKEVCIEADVQAPMLVTTYRYDDFGDLLEIRENDEVIYSCRYDFDRDNRPVSRTERWGDYSVVTTYIWEAC